MTARSRTRLAALLATSVVVLAGCGNGDDPQANDPNDQPSTSAKPTRTPKPSEEPSPSQSDSGAPARVAAPLYFVGDTPQGPRLFREFQQVEADNPLDEALALISAGDADDPDYGTLLTGGQFRVSSDGPDLVVELPSADAADLAGDMSKADAKLAIQQVVYTVQGVLQTRDPVSFAVDGELSPVFGIQPPAGGFKAAPQNNVLALVNVTQPQQNSEPGATFTASGVANSFEATVPWQVLDQSGAKVLEGFATADGWGDHLYPWQSDVDASGLAPGTYTFVAMTDDASDGEGAGPTQDTKTFTLH
jgi:hypothetical protein